MDDNVFVKTEDDDTIFFTDELTLDEGKPVSCSESWKILLVDDEPAVHEVTKLALNGFAFSGRTLAFTSAYSAAEAKVKIAAEPEFAMVFLDVVMETELAGLEVVEYVREELGNWLLRIVLRTGQPGQAPEREVVANYDINDYKAKTELTADKLFTVTMSALRSYRDLVSINNSRLGLHHIIKSSKDIHSLRNIEKFTEGVLIQMSAMIHPQMSTIIKPPKDLVYLRGLAASRVDERYTVQAGIGEYQSIAGKALNEIASPSVMSIVEQDTEKASIYFEDDQLIGTYTGHSGKKNIILINGIEEPSEDLKRLTQLFIQNVSVAYDNIELNSEIEETQREIVYLLGEAVETRSKETGNHVKRVAEISKLIALELGLSNDEAEVIKMASPLHDIGKIGIRDDILNKAGQHTDEEKMIMQTHVIIGHDILKSSSNRVLAAGAVIALEHHEKWDGSGYPYQKKGKDIHIYGRITALADVFDALGSDRCYKKAWPMDKIIDLFREERGHHFDPQLVDLLLENLDNVIMIRDRHAD